ncbi:Aste57867_312 [Aphanomyces stellatus]|uniref:Aste57867_312 protein n=1 Tax=Aphanomyces stellatus TaxID=120398 RepID=A0A485K2H7_9STRA|nr:hypothetical protein As57867_000312 [Aphanomyces stellatus]VFT77538.1 Aste57867_312 [Aphanomyces stellatus]
MQQPDKTIVDAIPVLPSNAACIVLPDFQIDLQVQDTSSLVRSWVWAQVVIRGQQLTVTNSLKSKQLVTIQTTNVTVQPHAGHQYLLLDNGKTVLTLSCPSPTLFGKFESVLRYSATTPYWVLPPRDIFQDLVDVATTIVETDKTITGTSKTPPSVTTADVVTYLAHIQPVYDHILTLTTKTDLLHYLCQLESDYLSSRLLSDSTSSRHDNHSFAHLVHRHHPTDYSRSLSDATWALANTDAVVCPHCTVLQSGDVLFDVRMLGLPTACLSCGHVISDKSLRLGAFRHDHPTFSITIGHATNHIPMPALRPDGDTDGFQADVSRALFSFERQTGMAIPKATRAALDATLTSYVQRLDLVAAMARHLVFVSQVCTHVGYWRHPTVLAAAVIRYNHFCRLAQAHPKKTLLPTVDIALVRHVHQTMSVLPCFPQPKQVDVAYAETYILWAEMNHGSAYSSAAPSFAAYTSGGNAMTQPLRKKKWEKWSRLPSRDCRFVGVDDYVADVVSTRDDGASTDDVCVVTDNTYVAVIGTPLIGNDDTRDSNSMTLTSGLRIRGKKNKLLHAVGLALLLPIAGQVS